MRHRVTALAVLGLAAGWSAAVAQTNAPTINAAPTTMATPSGPNAPAIAPAGPQIHNPGINPSAAGTQTGRERSGSTVGHVEHSGSQTLDANTHPLKALKANRQQRRQQRANQTGFPPPR